MSKKQTINFQFLHKTSKLKIIKVNKMPAFYIDQPTGSLKGIVINDKESAEALKKVAELVISYFEKEENGGV